MMVHAYNPKTMVNRTGGLMRVQDQLVMPDDSLANLGYKVRSCLK